MPRKTRDLRPETYTGWRRYKDAGGHVSTDGATRYRTARDSTRGRKIQGLQAAMEVGGASQRGEARENTGYSRGREIAGGHGSRGCHQRGDGPRQYKRAEVEVCRRLWKVEGKPAEGGWPEKIQEGGCRGMQEAMKIGRETRGGRPETTQEGGGKGGAWRAWKQGSHQGGGPRQYMRAEVEGCRRPWK